MHRYLASEHTGSCCEFPTSGISSAQIVAWVEELFNHERHSELSELHILSGDQRSKTGCEEMQSWERSQISAEFT